MNSSNLDIIDLIPGLEPETKTKSSANAKTTTLVPHGSA